MPKGLTVLQWVVDFGERIKQLQSISNEVGSQGSHVLKVGICNRGIEGYVIRVYPLSLGCPCMVGWTIHFRGIYHCNKAVCGPS